MASFNGIDLGLYCYVQTEGNEKSFQINSYPGIDGLEILDMGARGGTSHATGECYANNLANLYAVEQQFRGMQVAGTVGYLVDTIGVTWANVRLLRYRPVGEIYQTPGGVGRSYEMTFLHP